MTFLGGNVNWRSAIVIALGHVALHHHVIYWSKGVNHDDLSMSHYILFLFWCLYYAVSEVAMEGGEDGIVMYK